MSKTTKNSKAKGVSAKKLKFSTREKVLLAIIVVLIAALITALIGSGEIASLFKPEAKVNYSFKSGSSTITIPAEFDLDTLLEVHFIDVGQGDAILIRLPDGKDVLIDSGSGTNVSHEVRDSHMEYLESMNLGTLDYLIVTHPDSDHINMLASILLAYDVGTIFYNDIEHEHSQTYTKLLEYAAAEEGAETIAIDHDGDVWVIEDSTYGYKLSIIAPGYNRFEDNNSMSVLCLLEYADVEVLFTGDATAETELWFLEEYGSIDIDILKIGHHGSITSSDLLFLQGVDPEYAVISVGRKNSHQHPAPEVMNRLFDEGVVTYRTDRHGTVLLYIDGDGDFGFLPQNDVMTENNTQGAPERKLSPQVA